MNIPILKTGIIIGLITLLTGCVMPGGTKAGGDALPRELSLAVVDEPNTPVAEAVTAFDSAIEERSGGSIEVKTEWAATGSYTPHNETDLIHQVQSGAVDLAVIPTRAFDLTGVTAFRALQAPFVIDSDSLGIAVADSGAAEAMLSRLDGSGMIGLAMVHEGLRHPVGYPDAIMSPADLAGKTVRVSASQLSQDLFSAFGARPTDSNEFNADLAAGLIDATEYGFGRNLAPGGTLTSNITFYPKMYALVANTATYATLPAGERSALTRAAADAAGTPIAQELPGATEYCAAGGRIEQATAEQLEAFRVAADPVMAALLQDPEAASDVEAIQAMKADLGPVDPAAPPCG